MSNIAFIISVYQNDNLDFFKKSIDSLVSQDYGFKNINIYLGIDGPLSALTKEYIDQNKDLFYQIHQNESNSGLAFTLNRLIEHLEDEKYIFRMDADDICRNDRVSKQVNYFNKDKELLLLGSDLIEINESGEELRYKKMPTEMKDIIHYSIARNPFNHPTVAMRKDFFNIVGKYDESILKSQDYELWGRALQKGIKCTNVSEALLYFRIVDSYMQKRNSFVNYTNELKISFTLVFYFKKYSQVPKVLVKFILRIMPSKFGELAYKILRNSNGEKR